MKTRKKLDDPNAERIIQIFEVGASLNWFSSETTDLRFEDFLNEQED